METVCCMCGVPVTATDDDETPMCQECHGRWANTQAVRAIMGGEMDHLIPEMQEGGDDQ